MGELRQNMATKEWVIIASERAKRPHEFAMPAEFSRRHLPEWDESCPFCPGNEESDLEVLRLPQAGEWQVRVVRNRYPALAVEGDVERHFDGVHRNISGVGYHELLIHSRRHNACHATESPQQAGLAMEAFYQRGLTIAQDPRIVQLIYFQNHGISAGMSLPHPHGQLMALPIVPYELRIRGEEAMRHYDNIGRCVMCDMLHQELADQSRIVMETEHFVAFVPYAAYSPFHMWILPKRHQSSYLMSTETERADLGGVLHHVLAALHQGLNDPDYNYIIRSAPLRDGGGDYLHWYVTVVPRVSQAAGFELASGMFINTALPEESAAFLRTQIRDDAPSDNGHGNLIGA